MNTRATWNVYGKQTVLMLARVLRAEGVHAVADRQVFKHYARVSSSGRRRSYSKINRERYLCTGTRRKTLWTLYLRDPPGWVAPVLEHVQRDGRRSAVKTLKKILRVMKRQPGGLEAIDSLLRLSPDSMIIYVRL